MLNYVSRPLEADLPLLPNKIKRTAKVLILRKKKGELQYYALWQYKKRNNIQRLTLPGGQIKVSCYKDGEIKQEKVIEAAIRETLEEISVSELNIKYYLGVYSHKLSQKSGYKHTYLFIGKIKGKPKVIETDKFNSDNSCFYPLRSINKHPHAPHLQWIYRQFKKGKLEKPITRFIR
jgi:ADP-ribose pyrophosphatase YjhB (NUDIX family)